MASRSSVVTIAIGFGAGSFTSGSTVSVTAVGGVATFNNFALTTAGIHTLSASAGLLVGATSSSFTVYPGAADHFAISPISSPQTAGVALAIAAITAQDAYNNTATSFGAP